MDIEKIIQELTLEEKAGLCSGTDFWHTKHIERLNIPKAMMCDGPHGLRKQKREGDHLGINESIEAVCFPTASALASSFDRDLLNSLGETLGDECQAEDVAMLLGPGLNIKRSPLCGRNFEYFSEDPYLAGQLGTAFVKGLQGKGVAACVKHFAANNQETRRMSSTSQVDERTLFEIYLPAFEAVVKEAKTRSVMCSYNKVNEIYVAVNKELLTDILRKKWGFDGFVVTDWGAVKDRVEGLLAGLDLEMPGGAGVQDAKIINAVKNGSLDEAVLDLAVRNILRFLKDYRSNKKQNNQSDYKKDYALSAEFAKECAVLLKNGNNILPIDKTRKVAFVGYFAKVPRYQGAGSSHINVPHAVSAMEAAEGLNILYVQGYDPGEEAHNESLVEEAVKVATAADVAVLFVGLPDAYETEGVDRNTMQLPENQTKLIEAVAAVHTNTVVVLHGGSPVEMPWAEKVTSILNMYLSGDNVGTAEIELLFGDANPSGKLAESYPIKLEDNPSYLYFPGENGVVEYREGIYVGYRYYDKKKMEVRFPFGHGLSYTTFTYSNLSVNKTRLKDTEILTVTCKVKNTGNRAGKEVVQLYVKDDVCSVGRPIRELKGFAKVNLDPGEEKLLTFNLDKRTFAYFEVKLHDWYVESGSFLIEIGASSRDIRLCTEVEVESTTTIPMKFTKESTIGDIMQSERGRSIMAMMKQQMKGSSEDTSSNDVATRESVKQLGEGSEKMVDKMMVEMPLSALISFGRMSEAQLDSLLVALNA